jgi:hypothetical protein
MNVRGTFFLGAIILLTGTGCSPAPSEPVPNEAVEITPVIIEPAVIAEPPKLDPPSELAGHAWKSGDHLFLFQKGGNVLVRGGGIQESMPNGAPSRYEQDGENLDLDVLGAHYSGTWNGRELKINDEFAEYVGPNSDFLN